MTIHHFTTWGKLSLGQLTCIFRLARSCSLCANVLVVGVRVSQFLSVLLMVTALTLTLCFGVAAWRQSLSKDVDFTATIPHQENSWRAMPNN